MINNTTLFNSPVRTIAGKVELYEGSTLAQTFNHSDVLKSVSIERVGEGSKFFGFGICQKANVHLTDKNRELAITTANSMKIYFNGCDVAPTFYVSEVHRDENTNELSITAYDIIYKASAHTVAELTITAPYTIGEFAVACADFLGVSIQKEELDAFNTSYETGANFDGAETIRDALDDIAEATQTIYHLSPDNVLIFKRLDIAGEPVFSIGKADYFTLKSGDNRRLATICHTNELGDSAAASTAAIGSTQYVRANAFWDLREDVATFVESALAAVGGMTISQFDCSWRGNPLLEIGDKIAITTKDDSTVISYVFDDVIEYNGSLSEKTQWKYEDDEAESAENPTSLGEVLNQTFAKVDKVNKEIEIVASESAATSSKVSSLEMTTENIAMSVENVEATLDDTNENVGILTERVNATMTADEIKYEIQSELANGVDKVETSTGFTFNSDGLTVSKSDSEMETQITEDGMTVKRNGKTVLTANNVGVEAINLKAKDYLIIGKYSRFEDYGSKKRTACFWIGG